MDMHVCLEALHDNSSNARIFCLIHKMDLVQTELRDRLFKEREAIMKEKSAGMEITCFATSIWDETLYKVRDTQTSLITYYTNLALQL